MNREQMDQKITEAKNEFQKVQDTFNRNVNVIAKLSEDNETLKQQGTAIAARITTLEEIAGMLDNEKAEEPQQAPESASEVLESPIAYQDLGPKEVSSHE